MSRLKKVALITGASRGIGEACARHLAELGWQVVLAARSRRDLLRIAAELEGRGRSASVAELDVSDHHAFKRVVSETVANHGGLDLLVNNAGLIDPISRIAEFDPEDWSRVVDVNLKGVFYGLRFAIPEMLKHGGGTIVNISSGAANSALEGWSHYCATKAGVQRLTGVAHKEYGDQGVRVVGLSPGTVATQMQRDIAASGVNPVSRIPWDAHIEPDWVAKAVAFLATDGADEHLGADFSLKTNAGRQKIGMPPFPAELTST